MSEPVYGPSPILNAAMDAIRRREEFEILLGMMYRRGCHSQLLLSGPPLPHTDTIREDFGGTLKNHGFRLIDTTA